MNSVPSSSFQPSESTRSSAQEVQDRNLPMANISRIMKKVLPANVKVSKEAMMEIQKCVSEFISFITSEAGDKCSNEKRKTLNGDDILFALLNMGFDNYSDVLQIFLTKYRDSLKDSKRSSTEESRISSIPVAVKCEEEDNEDDDNMNDVNLMKGI